MKKILLTITIISLLATPLYSLAAEDDSFLGQTSHFLERVFSGEKKVEDLPEEAGEVFSGPGRGRTQPAPTARSNQAPAQGTRPAEDKGSAPVDKSISGDRDRVREHQPATSSNTSISSGGGGIGDAVQRTVHVNSQFSVTLEENASTGHRWEISSTPEVVSFIDSDYLSEIDQVNEDVEARKVGVPGKRIFKFNAIKEGAGEIELSLRSPAGEIVDSKLFQVKVVAEDKDIGKEGSFFDRIRDRVKDMVNRPTSSPDKAQGPGEFRPSDEANVPEEVRQFIEQKREEVRNKLQENQQRIQQIREEVQQRVEQKRQEIQQKLERIRNNQKRQTAERIHSRLLETRERTLMNFNNALDRMETVLTNITTRADKAQSEGKNIEEVETLVSNAQDKVTQARERVQNIFQKEYQLEFSNEEQLRESFQNVRDEVYTDLSGVRDTINDVRDTTESAADALNQILESDN